MSIVSAMVAQSVGKVLFFPSPKGQKIAKFSKYEKCVNALKYLDIKISRLEAMFVL